MSSMKAKPGDGGCCGQCWGAVGGPDVSGWGLVPGGALQYDGQCQCSDNTITVLPTAST